MPLKYDSQKSHLCSDTKFGTEIVQHLTQFHHRLNIRWSIFYASYFAILCPYTSVAGYESIACSELNAQVTKTYVLMKQGISFATRKIVYYKNCVQAMTMAKEPQHFKPLTHDLKYSKTKPYTFTSQCTSTRCTQGCSDKCEPEPHTASLSTWSFLLANIKEIKQSHFLPHLGLNEWNALHQKSEPF